VTWVRLAYANLTLSPLTTLVNVVLMALGTASIVLLLLASTQLQESMSKDARGIDLVLGASGSPVQLILSTVYHADVPPGNIKMADAEAWSRDSRVKLAVPVSLGDSYKGFRIVGTTPEFLQMYHTQVQVGRAWDEPMQAVLGASVLASDALSLGSTFAGAHGLVDGGHDHDTEQYSVVGVLAPTGTVVDRLILTSLESVWVLHDDEVHEKHESEHGRIHNDTDAHARNKSQDEVHDHEEEYAQEHADDHDVAHDHDDTQHPDQHAGDGHVSTESGAAKDRGHHNEALEITAMLINYSTPLAATTLPRQINAEGVLQAAAPAIEISRLLQLVGVGVDALGIFAWVLVATAALSIFAALYGSLRARRGELAMLRCLGATRSELLFYLIVEGLLMSALGITLGMVVGHAVMGVVADWLGTTRGINMTGWIWVSEETGLVIGLLSVGVLSAIVPAIQAYRTDVAQTLAEG